MIWAYRGGTGRRVRTASPSRTCEREKRFLYTGTVKIFTIYINMLYANFRIAAVHKINP